MSIIGIFKGEKLMLENIHFCGPYDNGTEKCCKYCEYFRLWGTCTGYCTVIQDDTCTFTEACESFKKLIIKRVD